MIVDVPIPSDFQTAGLNQLYLAWQIAMASLQEFDEALSYGAEDNAETRADYWSRSQPALANAYSLIQQAMELALKGRIAAVSPLLLIGDPGEWPGRATTEDVSFGEFRTLDAADLVKVHNSIAAPRLDDRFKAFWEELRRERNKIMHSATPKAFDPADVVRAILTAAQALFGDRRWPPRLLDMEEDGRLAALGFNDNVANNIMRQVEAALAHLSPAEAKRFLGFDKDQRAYICPHCYFAANKDWQEVWPQLAQFTTKTPGATDLACVVCETVTAVERTPCEDPDCKGNVVAEDVCLTCTRRQEECFDVTSGLTDNTLDEAEHSYDFVLQRGKAGSGGGSAGDRQLLPNDAAAKEHGAIALRAAHLQAWDSVSIKQVKRGGGILDLTDRDRVLGYWTRADGDLVWHDGVTADYEMLSLL
jgi:hypothetical protein